MNKLEFRKLIREEIRKVIKEVGDSSSQPYPVTGLDAVISTFKKQIQQGSKSLFTGEDGTITFKTEEGTLKDIYVGLKYNKKNQGLTMDVFVNNPNARRDGNMSFIDQKGTNLYKLMATVAATAKKITDAIPQINELQFESYPNWSTDDHTDQTAASKFIMSYVKTVYGGNISVKITEYVVYVTLIDRMK